MFERDSLHSSLISWLFSPFASSIIIAIIISASRKVISNNQRAFVTEGQFIFPFRINMLFTNCPQSFTRRSRVTGKLLVPFHRPLGLMNTALRSAEEDSHHSDTTRFVPESHAIAKGNELENSSSRVSRMFNSIET